MRTVRRAMADRRTFLGAVSGVAASLVLASGAEAQQSPPPAASPSPSPSPKPPSAAARAQAEAMRRFDPHLSDAQIDTIAHGIDGLTSEGQRLNPHGTTLKNADEPATRFAAAGAR